MPAFPDPTPEIEEIILDFKELAIFAYEANDFACLRDIGRRAKRKLGDYYQFFVFKCNRHFILHNCDFRFEYGEVVRGDLLMDEGWLEYMRRRDISLGKYT